MKYKLQLANMTLNINNNKNNIDEIKNNISEIDKNKSNISSNLEIISNNNSNIDEIKSNLSNIDFNSINKYSIENFFIYDIEIEKSYKIDKDKSSFSIFKYTLEDNFKKDSILQINCRLLYEYTNYNNIGFYNIFLSYMMTMMQYFMTINL